MKTLVGTLLALGLLSTAASAQYCPPGYGQASYGQSSYGHYRPTYGQVQKRIVEMPAEEAPAGAPQATEPAPQGQEPPQVEAPAPAPENAPQK